MKVIEALAGQPADIDRLLSEAEKIDVFPAVARRVLLLAGDDATNARALEETLQADQSLARRVLGVANSAAFARAAGRITSIKQAVVTVGFREIRELALAAALVSAHRTPDARSATLWEHSLWVALAAKVLARAAHYPHADEPFMAGLLHDFGIVVLRRVLGPTVYDPCLQGLTTEAALGDRERERFGLGHEDLGCLVMKRSRLPRALETAVQMHHDPVAAELVAPRSPVGWLVRLIHAADRLAVRTGHAFIGGPAAVTELELEPLLIEASVNLQSEPLDTLLESIEGQWARLRGSIL